MVDESGGDVSETLSPSFLGNELASRDTDEDEVTIALSLHCICIQNEGELDIYAKLRTLLCRAATYMMMSSYCNGYARSVLALVVQKTAVQVCSRCPDACRQTMHD